jgi:hypothetical protein
MRCATPETWPRENKPDAAGICQAGPDIDPLGGMSGDLAADIRTPAVALSSMLRGVRSVAGSEPAANGI